MNRRFAASLMIVTAGILAVPAAGAASAATQTGSTQVTCGPGEHKTENGMTCATDVSGDVGNGSSVLGFDLATIVALIGSLAHH